MAFPIFLGLVIVALGLSSILLAWFHPAPHETRLVKALSWPRKTQDRIGISLASLMLMAVGAQFAIGVSRDSWIPAAICAIVILVTALALGLREPAV